MFRFSVSSPFIVVVLSPPFLTNAIIRPKLLKPYSKVPSVKVQAQHPLGSVKLIEILTATRTEKGSNFNVSLPLEGECRFAISRSMSFTDPL